MERFSSLQLVFLQFIFSHKISLSAFSVFFIKIAIGTCGDIFMQQIPLMYRLSIEF